MSTEDNKWNLDRPPTKWERIYGSVFSILIFILMSLFLYASSLSIIVKEITNTILVTFLVAVLLFIGSGYLLVRVVFGKRKKPSAKAIIITGYVLSASSCMLLVASVFGLSNTPFLAATGFSGLLGSSLIISQGKRRGNS